jgi:hypothetical protein
MRLSYRGVRIALALPLLLGLQAQREPEDCRVWEGREAWTEPVAVGPIAAHRPVDVATDAVLAHEVVRIAHRGWRLGAELRLPLDDVYVYPVGTALGPQHLFAPQRTIHMCLPRVPAEISPPPAFRRQFATGMLPCLVDRDGDGRYEQVDLHDTYFGMHVPQVRLARSVQLPVPVQLTEDLTGVESNRHHLHRRITSIITVNAVWLAVEHAFQEPERGGDIGSFVDGPGGAHVYQLPEPVLLPPEPTGGPLTYAVDADETRSVKLIHGAVVEAGGVHFRVARRGNGWTMIPLESRFPRWIRFGCSGRSLILGRGD